MHADYCDLGTSSIYMNHFGSCSSTFSITSPDPFSQFTAHFYAYENSMSYQKAFTKETSDISFGVIAASAHLYPNYIYVKIDMELDFMPKIKLQLQASTSVLILRYLTICTPATACLNIQSPLLHLSASGGKAGC